MKNLSNLLLGLILLVTQTSLLAQNDYIKFEESILYDATQFKKTDFTNNENLVDLIEKMASKVTNQTELSGFFKYNGNSAEILPLKKKAIVVIKHQFNYNASGTPTIFSFNDEDGSKDEVLILHKEIGDKKWSDYLLNVKDILIVVVGGQDDLQNSSIKIERERSFFKSSFSDLITLANGVGAMGLAGAAQQNMPIRFMVINSDEIHPPCSIQVSHVNKESPIKIKIHEKNNFAFHVGVSGKQLDKNQVKFEKQQLTVSLDSTQKEEWKSNLIATLTWYPFGGRDIDRFEPVYKAGIRGKMPIHQLYKLTLERVGLFAGARLSKDPIQNLYWGFSYAVSKSFNVNIGWAYTNTITPSVTTVGNVNSLKDALGYADRKYERSFSFGISFDPSSIGEILGIGKSDSEK